MTYYVFVDFDGVLATGRQGFAQVDTKNDYYMMWSALDPVAMEFFNRIHRTFVDVEFVWTTSWRNGVENHAMTVHWAYSMWYSAGFRGMFAHEWKVNMENNSEMYGHRAEEIKKYLIENPADDYIIFDDSDYNFNKVLDKKRFIKTSPEDGILMRHMRDAWSLMGNWERK